MALLSGRQELRRRTADSLTLPDFEALTRLEVRNGHYLSLEARIEDTSIPVSMELQRQGDRLDYELCWGRIEYQGTVEVVEVDGEFEAQVTLDRFNGKRVYEEPDGKGGTRVMYRQGPRTERGGTPREIPADTLKKAAYWVPTIINHIARNVDYFLRELKGDVHNEIVRNPTSNRYQLETVAEPAAAVEPSGIDQGHGSPSAHYRRSHQRTIPRSEEAGLEALTVSVTGTYVNTDWGAYSTPDVLASLREHAPDILPRHFERQLLPEIVRAGHSYEQVREAYFNGREVVERQVA